MNIRFWDELESCVSDLTFSKGIGVRRAVPMACLRHSEIPVEYLVLSLSSAASAMEESWPLADRLNQAHLLDLYRSVSAVAADIAMHNLAGRECRNCGDLLRHWRGADDGYFDTHALAAG